MKKLIKDLYCAVKVLLHFCREHHATISMMPGIYAKQPSHNDFIAGVDTMLKIKPWGSFYQVIRTDYISNIAENEEVELFTKSY